MKFFVSSIVALGMLGLAPALAPTLAHAQSTQAQGSSGSSVLKSCRLPGIETAVQCGSIERPLSPQDARKINIEFVVVPALARRPTARPIYFLAGGPGQSAINFAGKLNKVFSRIGQRRPIVFVDQRGTGKSAPLACEARSPTIPLAQLFDVEAQIKGTLACLQKLQELPYGKDGGLAYFTTTEAMQDLDAVRAALGHEKIDLVGISYGTRAALEYLRLFPDRVGRMVIDGVAPPDKVLPLTAGGDTDAALDRLFKACDKEPECAQRYPKLKERFERFMASLPSRFELRNPLTLQRETVLVSPGTFYGMVRAPLYMPSAASALPRALNDAFDGRFDALMGLNQVLASPNPRDRMFEGMHFAIMCAEDFPRMTQAPAERKRLEMDPLARAYLSICPSLPARTMEPAYHRVGTSPVPVLIFSGAADPVTPPPHGESTAKALGPKSRHVVVEHLAHGVFSQGCVPDMMQRFFDAKEDDQALAVEFACIQKIPAPRFFVPYGEKIK